MILSRGTFESSWAKRDSFDARGIKSEMHTQVNVWILLQKLKKLMSAVNESDSIFISNDLDSYDMQVKIITRMTLSQEWICVCEFNANRPLWPVGQFANARTSTYIEHT